LRKSLRKLLRTSGPVTAYYVGTRYAGYSSFLQGGGAGMHNIVLRRRWEP